MLDFKYYRNFSRVLFKVNLFLGVLYCLSFVWAYSMLSQSPKMHYYIQTNNGFLFPMEPFDPQSAPVEIITPYFE